MTTFKISEANLDKLLEFVEERERWFEIWTIDSPKGDGYEVVLRIDGTYFGDSPEQRAAMQEHWAERVRNALCNKISVS